jgi:hypothetical protein
VAASKEMVFPRRFVTAKKICITLTVVGPQQNYFPWKLLALKKTTFFGGCRSSRKLLSLAVATFPWPFGKLSLVVVFLAATLQGNHP